MKKRNTQRGVALVVTLVMLAVVTLMAIVFLGVSRRERASVQTSFNQTDAKMMADTALARAQAEVVSRILASNDRFNYDFVVSTNYINYNGFNAANGNRETNVSYQYGNGQPLQGDDILQNQANLYLDPRAPVFVSVPGPNPNQQNLDFRFYLDLNRNGMFESNGILPVINSNGRYIDTNGMEVLNLNAPNVVYQNMVGDPEWIGVLEYPDRPHSSSNRFIGRYAYVVVPAGKTLDLNYIHNWATRPNGNNGVVNSDGFHRNHGIGSWELNLAGFFRDLNTNVWPQASYVYNPVTTFPNSGTAFIDAVDFLHFRYDRGYGNLKSAAQILGNNANTIFTVRNDYLDFYSDGVDLTGYDLPLMDNDVPTVPWSGSDNPNSFFTHQELFSFPTAVQPPSLSFRDRFQIANTNISSYDRYTFYRFLSQAAMDSKPDLLTRVSGGQETRKINLNFKEVAPDYADGTNFLMENWTALDFFTNTADRLLRSELPFGLTNIQVYPTNFYNAHVHRLLQLAANLTDARTNYYSYPNSFPDAAPSVFAPTYRLDNTNVYINGYTEITNNIDNYLATKPWVDLDNIISNPAMLNTNAILHGIPHVIGAKRGLPNFNEFELKTAVQVTRKLELRKSSIDLGPAETNQMFLIGVSNIFGLEAWNSYMTNNYGRNLEILVTNTISVALSNQTARVAYRLAFRQETIGDSILIPANQWKSNEFRIPLNRTVIPVSDSIYRFTNPERLDPLTSQPIFERNPERRFAIPNLWLYVTNRLTYILIDRTQPENRVIDFVTLTNLVTEINVTRDLIGNANIEGQVSDVGRMWLTNRVGGVDLEAVPTEGILWQIEASLGNLPLDDDDWANYGDNKDPVTGSDREKSINLFRAFMDPTLDRRTKISLGQTRQAPFSPTRKLVVVSSWQANDPLVHYTSEDLVRTNYFLPATVLNNVSTNSNLGRLNDRYRPWLGHPERSAFDPGDFRKQDPLIYSSQDWNFPTNAFPNVGWLGRVHRGTPWQTVYLKGGMLNPDLWAAWSGRADTHPTNDWKFVDLFTVAPNENAARGLLGVNQGGRAAWSAVLSGVQVLSNSLPNAMVDIRTIRLQPEYENVVVEPGTVHIKTIVDGINRARSFFPNQRFPNHGSVLSATELTVDSPFLNLSDTQRQYAIRDEVYERIPQQVLSLLKADEPRVVIYSYGQSLRPAPNSLSRSPGAFFQICTNYQITGEVATKSVIQLEGQGLSNLRGVVESYNLLPND